MKVAFYLQGELAREARTTDAGCSSELAKLALKTLSLEEC